MHDRMTLKASGWRAVSPLLQTPGNKGDYGLAGVAFLSGVTRASSAIQRMGQTPAGLACGSKRIIKRVRTAARLK